MKPMSITPVVAPSVTEFSRKADAHVVQDERCFLTPTIQRVLSRTPLAQWSAYAITLDGESGEARITTRGELVAWLVANDLPDLAAEARVRKVVKGALLVLALSSTGPSISVLFDPRRPLRPAPPPRPPPKVMVALRCAACGSTRYEQEPVDLDGLVLEGWTKHGEAWACRQRCASVLERASRDARRRSAP